MIDYNNVTLSVFDYSGNKVGILYTPEMERVGQAYDIKLTHEGSGWKELSFSIPKMVNGEANPLADYLVNEYLIKVTDGTESDVFIISEPKIQHSSALKIIDVSCDHRSSRLRMKKLYLIFDDTNGIGTCESLASIVLQGTGWTLGHIDTFWEPDGLLEKIRTLKSSGKEGAYQLLNKVCELFNARLVFHGEEQTVDIIAFSPYVELPDAEYPTLDAPEKMIELNYSKGLNGVDRKPNTENMITRLFVEGEYGDDGYVGIESVNPTGLNFLLNFDYFKQIGLFTQAHQAPTDDYLVDISTAKQYISIMANQIAVLETNLATTLWGTANYGIFNITNKVSNTVYDVAHIVSKMDVYAVAVGNPVNILLNNGTHYETKIKTITETRFEFEDATPDG